MTVFLQFLFLFVLLGCSEKTDFIFNDPSVLEPPLPPFPIERPVLSELEEHRLPSYSYYRKAKLETTARDRSSSVIGIAISLDNSRSMRRYVSKLADTIGVLVQKLTEKGIPYKISVFQGTGGTDGSLQTTPVGIPSVIHQELPDPQSALTATIQSVLSLESNSKEHPLETLIEAAKLNTYPVFKTGQTILVSLSDSADFLEYNSPVGIKKIMARVSEAIAGNWSYVHVGSPRQDPCPSEGADQYVLERIAISSGGLSARICDTHYGPLMGELAKRVIQLSESYSLTSALPGPQDHRITPTEMLVKVNGVEVPSSSSNGHVFDPESRSLRFFGTAMPSVGDAISVEFFYEGKYLANGSK